MAHSPRRRYTTQGSGAGGAGVKRDVEDLGLWFGLSYASFAVLPRVLMEDMPERWQKQMARLLFEYDEAFDFSGMPFDGTTIRATKDGKIVGMPSWVKNYRHPEETEIAKIRSRRHQKIQEYLRRRSGRLEVRE